MRVGGRKHRLFDAVYVHFGLCWQFWKHDIASAADLALAVLPLLDGVDDDLRAIGAANDLTIEAGRLIGHSNDGKGSGESHREAGAPGLPELEPVPVRWDSVDPACVVVGVITNPRITLFLATARQLAMQIFEQRTGVTPEEAVFQRAVAAALGG